MLKVKRKFARAAVPKWEVSRDVDKLKGVILICPVECIIDKRQTRGDTTIIRWCTAKRSLTQATGSVQLLLPVRGGGLGAVICIAQYLATRDDAVERVIVCTDNDNIGVLTAAAGNMLIRSRTPRTDRLSCAGYKDELLELFGTGNEFSEDASCTLNMSLDYTAFMSVFRHFMQSGVYAILSEHGALDLNWLLFNRDGISASEALQLYEKGEGGCPRCIETIEKVPGTLEFCITSMISMLFRRIGHETHFDPVPHAHLSRSPKKPAYSRSVNLREFYRTAGIGQVKGDLHLLGNVLPDANQSKTMVVGLRTAGVCRGYTAIVVTRHCLRDQGNLRRLRNLNGYVQILCTCDRLEKELRSQGVHAIVIRVGHTRNVLCSSFTSSTIAGRLHGSNNRKAKVSRDVSAAQEQRKWSDVLNERTIKLLSINVDFATWVYFTVILQVEHSYRYVMIKQTGVDEAYTAVERCLDFDLVRYENGNFIISLQGANRLLEFFRSYATSEVPTLAWEFVLEAAKLECVLKTSSPA